MYIKRLASDLNSLQIALLDISLYLGASLTHRTYERFRSFFFPHNTFLAKEVVMSRSDGQYLWKMNSRNKAYLLFALVNEEVSKCILVGNFTSKYWWWYFNQLRPLLLLEQRILELLPLRLLLFLFNRMFLGFFFFNLLIISCILLILLRLFSFISDFHSILILLSLLSFYFLPDSNAIWSLWSSSWLLFNYFHF